MQCNAKGNEHSSTVSKRHNLQSVTIVGKTPTWGVFLAAASRGWAGWTPPPPLPPRGWPRLAKNGLGEIWPKSRKTKKKWPHLGSLGVQANPF